MQALEDDGDDEDPWSLMLLETEPEYPRELDGDFFYDQLPEDTELPEKVVKAIEKFNESVKGVVLGYRPTNRAIDMSGYVRESAK